MKLVILFLFASIYTGNAEPLTKNLRYSHASSVDIILEPEQIVPTASNPLTADSIISEIIREFKKHNPTTDIPPINFLLYQFHDKRCGKCDEQILPQNTFSQINNHIEQQSSINSLENMREYLESFKQFIHKPIQQTQLQTLPQQALLPQQQAQSNQQYHYYHDQQFQQPLANQQFQQPLPQQYYQQPLANQQFQQPLANQQFQQPLANQQFQQPLANQQFQQPLANQQFQQPLSQQYYQQPLANQQFQQPLANQQFQQPLSQQYYQQPLADQQFQQPLANQQFQQPLADHQNQQLNYPQEQQSLPLETDKHGGYKRPGYELREKGLLPAPVVPPHLPLALSNTPYSPIPLPGLTHQMKNKGHMGFRGKKDRVRGRGIGLRGLVGSLTGYPLSGHLF